MSDVTRILNAIEQDDPQAAERLLPVRPIIVRGMWYPFNQLGE
jgi:hypothetical protein